MDSAIELFTGFENIDNLKNSNKKNINKKVINEVSKSSFENLLNQNIFLNDEAERLIIDIDNIESSNSEHIEKNLTFRSIISSLKLSVNEYKYQKLLFEQYVENYIQIYNEENIVKVLDLIRQVISDRRVILNSITDNLLKLQRLINERLKFDSMTNEDIDDVDKYITPDNF